MSIFFRERKLEENEGTNKREDKFKQEIYMTLK